MLELILAALGDDKAYDVVTFSIADKSSIADYMVVASGASSRQVIAMAGHLERDIKQSGFKLIGIEGDNKGDWVLIDAGDVIVHLFRPEVRAFYQLEKMWADQNHQETVTITASTNP